MSEFQKARDWLVTLAMTPGWWHYSREQAAQLENDLQAAGAWTGMREAVRAQLRAKGYRPPPAELEQMWR
ncbi:hypothetical protein M2375_000916 [Comamonas sp. BIGb0152]|uniref:hypothetical protein n=1 Tax=Comamonas sp. BIGb0152 TaxID=2940601 RepID=UPI0021678E81|nr:hypothetical protein [Comamonas sp. BIGb0152]MCS4292710.1 hypothetical protein [Comamonas sp. BIGb0152]